MLTMARISKTFLCFFKGGVSNVIAIFDTLLTLSPYNVYIDRFARL